MENSIKFLFSGDSALVIEFGNEISVDINKKIRKMMNNIKKENIKNSMSKLNDIFIEKNISAGGSADLLILTIFIHLFTDEE